VAIGKVQRRRHLHGRHASRGSGRALLDS
jgi:hypothetical protein